MEKGRFSIGLIIVFVGVVILLAEFGVFSFMAGMMWPLFILIPGLTFHYLFFTGVFPSGVLIPGGILTTIALMFFFCNVFGWEAMSWLWPGFILSVAIGLYEFYFFDRYKPRGALVASLILAIVSAVFFAFTLLFTAGTYVVAIILILVGLVMIARRPKAW